MATTKTTGKSGQVVTEADTGATAEANNAKTVDADLMADAENESATAQVDYVEQIGGNFNLHNATAIFGKANAVKALQAYAQHGGHGVLEEADYTNNLFGGLGAIDGKNTEARDKINAALNNLK